MKALSNVLLVLFASLINFGVIVFGVKFIMKTGKDCVTDIFREIILGCSRHEGAVVCALDDKCRGFKVSGQDCHLFKKYTKTSHKVNKVKICAASDEIIWVKEDSLCPAGFGNEFYGTKYKVVTEDKNQADAIAHCQSLGGFSRLADALDHKELSHLGNISTSVTGGVWLDGAQVPGSTEPAGGFKWTAAGVDLDPTMWISGDPNNGGGYEHSVYLYVYWRKLADINAEFTTSSVCECISPFY